MGCKYVLSLHIHARQDTSPSSSPQKPKQAEPRDCACSASFEKVEALLQLSQFVARLGCWLGSSSCRRTTSCACSCRVDDSPSASCLVLKTQVFRAEVTALRQKVKERRTPLNARLCFATVQQALCKEGFPADMTYPDIKQGVFGSHQWGEVLAGQARQGVAERRQARGARRGAPPSPSFQGDPPPHRSCAVSLSPSA